MPRKWTNHSSHGACGTHRWVEPTPFHMPLDPRFVDDILAMNKRIADIEKRAAQRAKRQAKK